MSESKSKKGTPKDAHADVRAQVMDASATPTFAAIARVLGVNGKTMRSWIRSNLGVFVSRGGERNANVRAAIAAKYLDATPTKDVVDAYNAASADTK